MAKNEVRGKAGRLLKHAAVGALIGTAVTAGLVAVLSALAGGGVISMGLAGRLTLLAAILGSTAAGLYAAARQGTGVITAGLCAGAAQLIILTLLMVILRNESTPEPIFLRIFIACFAGGAFGGVLKLGKKRKKSKLRA